MEGNVTKTGTNNRCDYDSDNEMPLNSQTELHDQNNCTASSEPFGYLYSINTVLKSSVSQNSCQSSQESGSPQSETLCDENNVEQTTDLKTNKNNGAKTKEQKQKVNEQIVISECSPASSETGSWELVIPSSMCNSSATDIISPESHVNDESSYDDGMLISDGCKHSTPKSDTQSGSSLIHCRSNYSESTDSKVSESHLSDETGFVSASDISSCHSSLQPVADSDLYETKSDTESSYFTDDTKLFDKRLSCFEVSDFELNSKQKSEIAEQSEQKYLDDGNLNKASSQNHFFIDASSLLDESELAELTPPKDDGSAKCEVIDSQNIANKNGMSSSDEILVQFEENLTMPVHFAVESTSKENCLEKANSEDNSVQEFLKKEALVNLESSPESTFICSENVAQENGHFETVEENLKTELVDQNGLRTSILEENLTDIGNKFGDIIKTLEAACTIESEDPENLKENVNDTDKIVIEDLEDESIVEIDEHDATREDEVKVEESDKPKERPVLIRRNTFELEPDDDRLAILRQDYERRQGSLVFQNAIPQYSKHVIGDEGFTPPASFTAISQSVIQTRENVIFPVDVTLSRSSFDSFPPTNATHNLNSTLPRAGSTWKTEGLNESDRVRSIDNLGAEKIAEFDTIRSYKDDVLLPETPHNSIIQVSAIGSTSGINTNTFLINKSRNVARINNILNKDATTVNYTHVTSTTDLSTNVIFKSGSGSVNESLSLSEIMSDDKRVNITDDERCQQLESISSSTSSAPADKGSTSWTFDKPLPDDMKTSSEVMENQKCSQKSSLGYFIDFSNDKLAKQDSHPRKSCMSKSENCCGFYIDLSKTSQKDEKVENPNTDAKNKKNMFPLFIDIGNEHRRGSNGNLSKSLVSRRDSLERRASCNSSLRQTPQKQIGNELDKNTERPNENGIDSTVETESNPKPIYMFIENESPVLRRKSSSSRTSKINRHSWDPTDFTDHPRRHKRTKSLSVDRNSCNLKCETSKSSSSSTTSPLDDQSNSSTSNNGTSHAEEIDKNVASANNIPKQMTASCYGSLPNGNGTFERKLRHNTHSFDSIELEEVKNINVVVPNAVAVKDETVQKKRRVDVQLNETFDKSSTCSVSDQMTKDDSPTLPDATTPLSDESTDRNSGSMTKNMPMETIVESKETKILKNDKHTESKASFVKLSDLDHPSPKHNVIDHSSSRMTRSIPEGSWADNRFLNTRTMGTGSVGTGLNSKSLSRLFPHLHNNMSTSTPSMRSKSPGQDTEDMVSEMSDFSSMQSSVGQSGLDGGSTEDTSQGSWSAPRRSQARLGDDLLRMFIDEIGPDVTVQVGARRVRAHKCILASRCQYFAAMLSGGWVESAGNVISLQGFSYQAVHFALCHIYSGASDIPESISLVELATLADMLGLEGLKEVVAHTLKLKHCHLFHKPCSVCAVGVLECLPLAAAYGLDDLYRKSLRWIARYFVRVWPSKAFASLPRELQEKCYQQHVVHMSVDSVLETALCCDKLLATLPSVRWAEPVSRLTTRLLEACINYIAKHFNAVLASRSFLSLGKELSWNISRLEDSLWAATECLSPEQACRCYAHLHDLIAMTSEQSAHTGLDQQRDQWSPNFAELLRNLLSRCETTLVRQALRACRSQAWQALSTEQRCRLRTLACLPVSVELNASTASPEITSDRGHRSRLSVFSKRSQTTRSTSTSGSRSIDLRQVRIAMQQHYRRAASSDTVSSDPQTHRRKIVSASQHQTTSKTVKVSTDKTVTADIQPTTRPKTWPVRYTETKSRYLEPRISYNTASTQSTKKDLHIAKIQQNAVTETKQVRRVISSSDSSRTTSPAVKRALGSSNKTQSSAKIPSKQQDKPGTAGKENVGVENQSKDEGKSTKALGSTHDTPVMQKHLRRSNLSLISANPESSVSNDSLVISQSDDSVKSDKKVKSNTDIRIVSKTVERKATSLKSSPVMNKENRKIPKLESNNRFSPAAVRKTNMVSKQTNTVAPVNNKTSTGTQVRLLSTRRNVPLNNAIDVKSPTNKISPKNSPTNVVQNKRISRIQTSRSITSPTKSSAAKSVHNVLNKKTTSEAVTKKNINNKKINTANKNTNKSNASSPVVTVERSSTFLKDQPTVLKKVE